MSVISELESKASADVRKKAVTYTLPIQTLEILDGIGKMYNIAKNEIIDLALIRYFSLLKAEETKPKEGVFDFLHQ